jgi:hypothetical protein
MTTATTLNPTAWADSRETCEFVAEALGYDNEQWEQPDDSDTIWKEAARLAVAAGHASSILCWGRERRPVTDR